MNKCEDERLLVISQDSVVSVWLLLLNSHGLDSIVQGDDVKG